jgi:hypothetical protein
MLTGPSPLALTEPALVMAARAWATISSAVCERKVEVVALADVVTPMEHMRMQVPATGRILFLHRSLFIAIAYAILLGVARVQPAPWWG